MRPAADFATPNDPAKRFCGKLPTWNTYAQARADARNKTLYVSECTECLYFHATKLAPLGAPLSLEGMEARVVEANAEGWADGKQHFIRGGIDYRHVSYTDPMSGSKRRATTGDVDPSWGW